MQQSKSSGVSRRDALKTTGQVAAASVLAGVALPHVHAAGSNTVQVALIGCGGRGTGAAINALSTKKGPTKLVAMADVFKDKLDRSYTEIAKRLPAESIDVPIDRRFVDFDGYKKAIDALKPNDVAIFATPPAFRWVHFEYAIQKGVNVFMEKPVTIDGPTSRKMFKLSEAADKKNLKVGVGLMCRHCPARQELAKRIQDGQIGDLTLLRAYRMVGPTGSAFAPPYTKGAGTSELLYQIRNFHGFLWASGGAYSDFLIHNIDESCWMKGSWPVSAKASGGRHYRGEYVDQNFDTYSVEYTFADGAKLFLEGRNMVGCHQEFASYAHGTKGSAIISTSSHWPSKARLFKSQNMVEADLTWRCNPEEKEHDPYQVEWEDLMNAIRLDKPYNEAKRGTEASLVTVMGRMAAHTGKIITYDDMMKVEHEFAPDVDKLTLASNAPLQVDPKTGKYPIPEPGVKKNREY